MQESKIGMERLREIIEESFKHPASRKKEAPESYDSPTDWKDLQSKVKALYSELGCTAKENFTVKGARTKHNIDVFAIFTFGGQTYRIIIDCKYWNSKVKKEQVATLLGIIADTGAEKGVIVSRIGFQAGARRLAEYTNISLVTYNELLRDSSYFIEEFRLSSALKRIRTMEVPLTKFFSLMRDETEKIGEWWYPSQEAGSLLGSLSILKSKIESLDSFTFPKGFVYSTLRQEAKEIHKVANNRDEYVNLILENISILEKDFEELRDKIFSE